MKISFLRVMCTKDADKIPNIENADQTAPMSNCTDLGLQCMPMPICPNNSGRLLYHGKGGTLNSASVNGSLGVRDSQKLIFDFQNLMPGHQ